MIIPDDEVPGAVLMYQRGRSEEGRPMSSASPSTEVPECPSVTGEDQEMKNEVEEHVTESAMKRARHSSAAEIPVPDDDDLFIEDAFIVEMEPGTLPKGCCLIDGEFELDEAFLAEVSEKHMTLEEKEKMIQAKQKELMQYFDNKVWEFTELGKHQTSRVITARWVLVWKPPADGEFQRKAKARLVLRGFQDPDYLSLEKNSPTASKTSKMILLSLTPVLDWTIFCGDVRAAFLSGATFDREIIVKLPSDCSAMLGTKGPTYMKMKKSAFGLCDAPLLWWTEADRRLRKLNLKRHRLCKCTYMCYNSSQVVVGLVIVHVDDLLMSFNMKDNEAVNKIQEIRKAFDFGKWQELKQGEDIIYCAGRISKHGKKVSLDFEEYMKKVMPITIHKGRAQKDPLTASEVRMSIFECLNLIDSSKHQQSNGGASFRVEQNVAIRKAKSRFQDERDSSLQRIW